LRLHFRINQTWSLFSA